MESFIVAMYLAYLPAQCGDQRVVVQVRSADLNDDSPPEEYTGTYDVALKDGKILVGTTENGRRTEWEAVASFTGDEDDRLIDFIVRINKHIAGYLEKSVETYR